MNCSEFTVLGISGSPHRHGNTETLLDEFMRGAEDAGGSIEKVVLKSAKFEPCRGCNACHKTGLCVVKDDAVKILENAMSSDILAVASPIYSMGITAELKGLIDRGQYIWAQKFIKKTRFYTNDHIRHHKGLFISTAGTSWDNVFDGAFPMITAFFNTLGFEYFDNVIANDMDRWGGVKGHPSALSGAFNAGQNVVFELKRI